MAWTAPKTWVASATLTAADLNTHIRDNLLETGAAKATEVGGLVASGPAFPNVIAQRLAKFSYVGTSIESTTSTSYTDLSTSGPSVSVDTGTSALVLFGCRVDNTTSGAYALMSVALTGATSVSASDDRSYNGVAVHTGVAAVSFSGLTPGTHTFTAKYRATSGTAQFQRRRLTVLAF